MKFLCQRQISRAAMETIREARDLFRALERQRLIKPDDLIFLHSLLRDSARDDLAKKVERYQNSLQRQSVSDYSLRSTRPARETGNFSATVTSPNLAVSMKPATVSLPSSQQATHLSPPIYRSAEVVHGLERDLTSTLAPLALSDSLRRIHSVQPDIRPSTAEINQSVEPTATSLPSLLNSMQREYSMTRIPRGKLHIFVLKCGAILDTFNVYTHMLHDW